MSLIIKDRISETTTTSGTSDLALGGATPGYQSFAVIGDTNTVYYCITDGNSWEVGLGTYSTTGPTLARTTVYSNSLGTTAKISLSVGVKNVFAVYPAEGAVTVNIPTATIQVPSGGVLPVANGGTGSNTATFSGANITNLNASNISAGVLAVAQGGTGSSTATFSGANITSLNASNISSGTIGNSYTTASSSNGANTIVSRDANGDFSARIISATTFSGALSGSGAAATSLNGSNVSSGIVGVTYGGTGANTLTLNNVILGNTTNAVQFVAPGTSGNVLTSDGTTWASTAPGGGFAAGTRMIFAQNTAPTGWTKDTTNYNDHAIRVVTGTAGGTGGTVGFTTAFASQAVNGTVGTSGATTLTTTQIPSHSHQQRAGANQNAYVPVNCGSNKTLDATGGGTTAITTVSAGSGGSHTHTGGTFTGTAIDLSVKYLNVITATKD